MTDKKFSSPALIGAALFGLLAMVGSPAVSAQQHVEDARVISSTPIRMANGGAGYSVTYEYGGRQYTTVTDSPPGDYIQLQLSPMGVMADVQNDRQNDRQADMQAGPGPGGMQQQQQQQQQPAYNGAEPWRNVTPEQGVVLSGTSGGAVAPAPAPMYYGAPPVVYAPQPMYAAPAYGYYGYPYASYPPIGLSLNFGYSSWRGGGGGRRWR
jgi:hypothetical protein